MILASFGQPYGKEHRKAKRDLILSPVLVDKKTKESYLEPGFYLPLAFQMVEQISALKEEASRSLKSTLTLVLLGL